MTWPNNLTWAGSSQRGPRQENQDAFALPDAALAARQDKGVLLVLCDGVGGEQGGRLASGAATKAAMEAYYNFPGKDVQQALAFAAADTDAAVKDTAAATPGMASMASTLVLAVVLPGVVHMANVGDSRGYVFHADGRCVQITTDHNWVAEQLAAGAITQAQAEASELRSMITRSLGAAPDNRPSFASAKLRNGDRVLLCSDGLHGAVSNRQMADVLASQPEPQPAADALVARAIAQATSDNTTAVVLNYDVPSAARRWPWLLLCCTLLAVGAVAAASLVWPIF